MTEADLLKIRIEMKALISEREAMKAFNVSRSNQGYAQGYGAECFEENAASIRALAIKLE